MEFNRRFLNEQQSELKKLLLDENQFQNAKELFLRHHAMLHSARMAKRDLWSYPDEIFGDLLETQVRLIPPKSEHSIAWLIWHITRIEDITMNLLVAGSSQVFQRDGWYERIGVIAIDTGNTMDEEDIAKLSQTIQVETLLDYRIFVGRRTEEIVHELEPGQLNQPVDPTRIAQVLAEGAVVEAASVLTDYWSKRTIAGLLLMPATRHPIVHLNEADRLKQKILKI